MPSRSSRKRQTRLGFTPLPSSSPAAKDYHKQIQDRAAAVVIEGSPSASTRRKKQKQTVAEAGDTTTTSSVIPTPPDEDQDSDDQPLRPTQRSRRGKQQRLDFSSARDPTSFDPPVRLTSSSKPSKSQKGGMFSSQTVGRSSGRDSDSDSDDSDVVVPPSRRRSRKKSVEESAKRVTRSSNMPVVDEDEDDDEIAVGIARPVQRPIVISEDEDEDMPTTLGKQQRQRKQRSGSQGSFIDDSSPPVASSRQRNRQDPSSSVPPDSPPVAEDSADDVVIVDKSSRKRRRRTSSDEDEDEDEEEVPKTPRRRLKQRKMTQQEKNDLEEDLEFFKPSSDDEESGRPARGTQSTQKNARQKALEKLKRKRGTQSSQVEPGQSSRPITIGEEEEDGAGDESDELEILEEEDEEDEEDEVQELSKHTSKRDMFREDEDDAGFIEEEEEGGLLGALDIPEGMPIEFTQYARMKAKELFKFAVEWFVQRKINPAFPRDDQLYQLTFRKLDDEVQGLSNSKFTSSAWTASFITALQARPGIAFERLDRNGLDIRDKCEACNRSNHPPKWKVQFQGRPYNRETLDEVPDEEDEENSDDGSPANRIDQAEWDVQGREVLPESHSFYLGKFCFANTEIAHSLYHWRNHLAEVVETWLKNNGYLSAAEIVRRDALSTRKRSKEANKIYDEMERHGQVKVLWKAFSDNIDNARKSKQSGRFYAESP